MSLHDVSAHKYHKQSIDSPPHIASMLTPHYYYYTACAFVALNVYASTQLHTSSAPNGPNARWHLALANVDHHESIGLKEQRPHLVPLIDPLVLVTYKCINIAAMLALYIHVCVRSRALKRLCSQFMFLLSHIRPKPVANASLC